MLWIFFACQGEPKDQPKETQSSPKTIEKQQSKPPVTATKVPSTVDSSHAAPKPLPLDTRIDSKMQKVVHPPPLIGEKQQRIDVCTPYYKILELESQRGTATASEQDRISALRDLNRVLEYHPEDLAQSIVELEKESFEGAIHLSLQSRKEFWYNIHSYIGNICRADLSNLKK